MAFGADAGPHLAPSLVIGLGAWGRAVAARVAAALRERSPELARACLVLPLEAEEPDPAGLIRARLRATRDLGMIRSLEAAGLIRIDPVVAPTTHVYLVGSLQDDPDMACLGRTAELVVDAAGNRRGDITLAALIDLGADGTMALPAAERRFPVYVVEPVTSHGLVIGPEEYRDAVAEALVATAQPGGGHLLADDRDGLGTLGIAWLSWSPAALRSGLARRLSRDALARCLEAADPPPQFRAGVRETEAWRLQTPAERLPALTRGLPFTVAADLTLALPERLFGRPERRRRRAPHLKRCAAVLQRRVSRWERLLERNARSVTGREGEALERSLAEALGAGPDGLTRARCLADALGREASHRLDLPPAGAEPPRLMPAIWQVERAEAALPPRPVNTCLGVGFLLIGLIWYAAHGRWLTLLGWAALLGLVGAAYAAWRQLRIDRATRAAVRALRERAEVIAREALLHQLELLDRAQEARCGALAEDLTRSQEALRHRCRPAGPGEPDAQPGALSLPLVAGPAIEPLHRDMQPQVAELAAHLAAGGVLLRWREPGAVLALAEELTTAFLAGRLTADPGQLAARAYGDRLAERLYGAVRGLLDWAQPLLARACPLPEGQRWLLWPEGLPCPPVPPEVQVIPAARSCAAAVTVIRGLQPAGIRPREEKAAADHPA